MYYSRLIRVLFVALSFALVAKAINPNLDGAVPTRARALGKRQVIDLPGIGDDDDDKSTTTSDSKPTPTDDDEETTTSDKKTTTTKDDDPTTKPTPTTSDKETKTDDEPTQKTEETTSKKDDEESSKSRAPTTSTRTKVVTTTNAEGKPTSFTTEDAVISTPGLSDDENGGGDEGMSKETRNIVIGVVVGVGGAIVIGALAFVIFRIRNRKRAAEGPDHYATMEPMDKPDSSHAATGSVGGARNPFQSTLETYHAPTHVNASSNF